MIKESYIKWAIMPCKGTARENKTGSWRSNLYPVFKEWKCQACPPGEEVCSDATIDCPSACRRACLLCWVSCPDDSIILQNGVVAGIDLDYCKGCGICEKICPRGAFQMKEVKQKWQF